MEKSSSEIQLSPAQLNKYDALIKLCPDAINRENYSIVWITKDPNSFENTIYTKAFKDKGFGRPVQMDNAEKFQDYVKIHVVPYVDRGGTTLVITGGQFVNDVIKIIQELGEPGNNIKILIFTLSLEMNKPLQQKFPDIIIQVGSFIGELFNAINNYLKQTKVKFRSG